MGQKKEYRSSIRSRRMIREAFQQLLQEKKLEEITVTEIVNRADLNRSTFYAHYPDIQGVVEEIQEEIVSRNIALIQQMRYQDLLKDPMPYLQSICGILAENIDLLKRLGHTEQLHRRLDEFRRLLVEDIFSDMEIPEQIRSSSSFPVCVHFFIGGIMNAYQQWAEGTLDCTLEEISRDIARMIQISGKAFLDCFSDGENTTI